MSNEMHQSRGAVLPLPCGRTAVLVSTWKVAVFWTSHDDGCRFPPAGSAGQHISHSFNMKSQEHCYLQRHWGI